MKAQGQVDDGLVLLDQARKQLGDLVDLRLERAKLLASKKGEQTLKDLMDLSLGDDKFSKPDRKRLLSGLAGELNRKSDLEGARQLLAQLAEEYPSDIELRINLLELALNSSNEKEIEKKKEIEKNIKDIESIEGNEGLLSRYCQVRYLIWQVKKRDVGKEKKAAILLTARELLEGLRSRRGDWSVIPLASAELAEQELDLERDNLKKDEIQAREDIIIASYEEAIKLGQRGPVVVNNAMNLLFKNGRGSRAYELLSSLPVESQFGAIVGQAGQNAFDRKDFQLAEQFARKTVEANPDSFQARQWLATILQVSGDQAKAGKELRIAVDLSPRDPERWITLVSFLLFTTQPIEAEKTIHEAEAKLAPMALALCCEKMGRFYDGFDNTPETKRWNDEAKKWFEKAETDQPEDEFIKRRLTEFFVNTRQLSAAQEYLETIRKQVSNAKSAETRAWAKRTLAFVLADGADRAQLTKALSLFEQNGQAVPAGQEGKQLSDPEDLRALARILGMQKTAQYRKRAAELLEGLTSRGRVTAEDQVGLARLYESIDDWPRARQKYQDLIGQSKSSRDVETRNRRWSYLFQFASRLLQHFKPGEEQDLIEAQELVDEIKQLQLDPLVSVPLQVDIYRLRKQIDRAVELIQATAKQMNESPQNLDRLASLAEKVERFDVAEQIYRRLAAKSGGGAGQPALSSLSCPPRRCKRGSRDLRETLDRCRRHSRGCHAVRWYSLRFPRSPA